MPEPDKGFAKMFNIQWCSVELLSEKGQQRCPMSRGAQWSCSVERVSRDAQCLVVLNELPSGKVQQVCPMPSGAQWSCSVERVNRDAQCPVVLSGDAQWKGLAEMPNGFFFSVELLSEKG